MRRSNFPLIEDKPPIVYEQGDIGFHLQVHNPWIPRENIRYSYSWIKGAVGPAADRHHSQATFADQFRNGLPAHPP